MSPTFTFETHEWDRFSVPHSLRLVGENQHLLGGGSITVATSLRLQVEAEETDREFSLGFYREPWDEDVRLPAGDAPAAEYAVAWENAIGSVMLDDPSLLAGLALQVNFGRLWDICPADVLLSSPALAAALTVAIMAHRRDDWAVSEVELAETACQLRRAVASTGAATAGRFYSESLLSIVGGAGYVEPGGRQMNVQQLLPPDSLLLALEPGVAESGHADGRDADVAEALIAAWRERGAPAERGDEELAELFRLGRTVLSEEQTTMLYGLLRVRQMTEAFLEYVGEPFVDNDRLAEVCDEESAILEDYFGFPAAPYASIRATAAEAGALGCKLTWAFGGYPAAIVVAPGRRGEVQRALSRTFRDAHFLPVEMDPAGLCAGPEDDLIPAPL